MNREFTVVIEQGETRFIAVVPELPGCFTQGDSLDDVQANIKEAIAVYLDIDHQDFVIVVQKGQP